MHQTKTGHNSKTPQREVLLLFTESSAKKHKKANPVTLCALFNKKAKATNTHYSYAYYEDLLHVIGKDEAYILDTKSGKKLAEFDLVYQRRWGDMPEMAVAVATYLRHNHVPFLDDESDRPGSMDKVTQHWRLWDHGLPFPKTVFAPKRYVRKWIESEIDKNFDFPLIMKGRVATRGNDNYLVGDKKQALELVKANPQVSFMIQEFIPNDGDYRVLVADDNILLVIHRKSNGKSHTNNTSKGGTATIVSKDVLTPEMQQASIKAAKVFKRNLAGVDLVVDNRDNQTFAFFEVNRSPQIEASSYSEEKVVAINDYFNKRIDEGDYNEEEE